MAARFALGAVAGAFALVLSPSASAHLHSGIVAEDFLASIAPPGRLASALSLRIYRTDRALALTVRPPHRVTVIGYLGEPFIRVSNAGVFVDTSSPTAAASGLVRSAAKWKPGHARWRLYSTRETVVWHAPSLRGLPPGVDRAAWRVPIVVDGRSTALRGEIWRVPAPLLWPWLALAAPFAIAGLVLVLAARTKLRAAIITLGLLAAAATVIMIAAFTLTRNASNSRWFEGGNELVFALIGVALLIRGSPNVRAFGAIGLGLLALTVGLTKAPVLLHGVVLSALAPTPTRVAVAIGIWSGAAASLLGLIVFFEMLDEPDPKLERMRLDRARGS